MSKRILFLLLTVMTCTLFVVGCGGSDGKDGADVSSDTVTSLQNQIDLLNEAIGAPALGTAIADAKAIITTDDELDAVVAGMGEATMQTALTEIAASDLADVQAEAAKSVSTLSAAFAALKAADADLFAQLQTLIAALTEEGFTAFKTVIKSAIKVGYANAPAAASVTEADTAALEEAAKVSPESCSTCHNGSANFNGDSHQAVYDERSDDSNLTLTIDSVVTTGTTSVLTFTVEQDGVGYAVTPAQFITNFGQKTFYAAYYDDATRKVTSNVGYSISSTTLAAVGSGVYTITKTGVTTAPETADAFVFGYVALAADQLDLPDATGSLKLYDNLASAALTFGTSNIANYVSNASVAGCEKCHGAPYLKHGYRAAEVTGLPDFVACKVCHYDTRDGHDALWQLRKDDYERYVETNAGADMTAAELTKYAYKASVMNDVHMSHNMEFAYPQSMASCVTCHEGKIAEITDDDFFVLETCQSCHALDSLQETVNANSSFTHTDITAMTCENCHTTGNGFGAPLFSDIHSGYDKVVYTAAGEKYADELVVSIDSVVVADDVATITFSATSGISGVDAADIVPTVYVAGYGYDTKDFIVSNHDRDADRNRIGEYTFGTESPYFSDATTNGASWSVKYDLTALDADGYYSSGVIKRIEVAVAPKYEVGTGDDAYQVGLDAPSVTILLSDSSTVAKDPIVDEANGCNTCHDQLATTFHSGDRGGNVVVCRMCHVPSSGGSHLEMQSRSIDSYVHAIHKFQAFDPGDVDFDNTVEAFEYAEHIEHGYPNFTIMNCESCHVAGTYNVPDQSKSLPGKFSAADTLNKDRNIGDIPSYDAGPASRACGSCHRAAMINEDDAGSLVSFNAHTKAFGYLVEDATDVLSTIVSTIMAQYE